MFISFKSYVRKEEKAKNPEMPRHAGLLGADPNIISDYWRMHPYDSGIWIGDSDTTTPVRTWTTSITSATNTTAYTSSTCLADLCDDDSGTDTSITWEVK